MKKIKRPKINQYVLVTRWCDRKWGDPWSVGTIAEWGEDKCGSFFVLWQSRRRYRNCWALTEKEGADILKQANTPPSPYDKIRPLIKAKA